MTNWVKFAIVFAVAFAAGFFVKKYFFQDEQPPAPAKPVGGTATVSVGATVAPVAAAT